MADRRATVGDNATSTYKPYLNEFTFRFEQGLVLPVRERLPLIVSASRATRSAPNLCRALLRESGGEPYM